MTRYGIDAGVAIRLARENLVVPEHHQLVAPNLLRSQALSIVYRSVGTGETSRADGIRIMEGITVLRIRVLGDRVSRGTAWRLAEKWGWADTTDAEYLAVAQLQAEALVTLDPERAALAEGIVRLAAFDELLT